jgi:hypothetical protein
MPRDISHPANREVLLYLMLNRRVYRQPHEVEATFEPLFCEDAEIELRDLRTHPDLSCPLRIAAGRLPGVKNGYILGYDVLINRHDIVFALAMSMNYIALRLNPPASGVQVAFDQTKTIENLSSEWQSFGAFGPDWSTEQVEALCRKALARADDLAG